MASVTALRSVSALHIAKQVQTGTRSASDILEETYASIRQGNHNAFLALSPELAFDEAKAVDRHPNKSALPLAGVPIAIKDNICTQGVRTTCASRMLEHYVPPYDATVITKLRAAGAVLVGKTNMDEFAMGSSNENSAFGPVLNPHDITRTPGGSSGGSAVAVAGGYVPLSLGSDTGGSVRQPGAFTGVYAHKPTYGCVSRYGLIAFASSLDQIGPFAKNIDDLERLYKVIAGFDPKEATSAFLPLGKEKSGVPVKVIGYSKAHLDSCDVPVRDALLSAMEVYRGLGCEFVEVDLPHAHHALSVYYILAPAECSSNLARFDGVRYGFRSKDISGVQDLYELTRTQGFGKEVKRRIMLGTYVLSAGYYDAYYAKAQKVRTLIKQDFEQVFERVDALFMPTTPTLPFKLGEKTSDPLAMYMADIFTLPASLAGVPALNVPCKLDLGLPVGFQLVGRNFEDQRLFDLARVYERKTRGGVA